MCSREGLMLGDQEDAATGSPRFILAAHTPPALPDYILKTLGKSWKERKKKREGKQWTIACCWDVC